MFIHLNYRKEENLMEVTLGTKILARLADFSICILIITPVVSVILHDRIKNSVNATGIFGVAVASSMFINFGVWIVAMMRWNSMHLIVSSFALLILSIRETVRLFKDSHPANNMSFMSTIDEDMTDADQII
jgi:hypothetical protein